MCLNYIPEIVEFDRMQKLKFTFFKRFSNRDNALDKKEKKPKIHRTLNYSSRLNYVIVLSLILLCLIMLSLNAIELNNSTNECGSSSITIELGGILKYNLERQLNCVQK